jgi:hypothetical protein
MRGMGIEALYRKPNTSKRHPVHQVYPYLLRGWRSSTRTQKSASIEIDTSHPSSTVSVP